MKDKWMNIGFEGEDLQPYLEPEADISDELRIRKLCTVSQRTCRVRPFNALSKVLSWSNKKFTCSFK